MPKPLTSKQLEAIARLEDQVETEGQSERFVDAVKHVMIVVSDEPKSLKEEAVRRNRSQKVPKKSG